MKEDSGQGTAIFLVTLRFDMSRHVARDVRWHIKGNTMADDVMSTNFSLVCIRSKDCESRLGN